MPSPAPFSLNRPQPRGGIHRSASRTLLGAVAVLCVAALRLAADSAPAGAPADGNVVGLPRVTVTGGLIRDCPPFPKADVAPPSFADGSAPIDLYYPAQAYKDGVTEGLATVGVMLDRNGAATDYLLIAYSRRYFGDALLREAKGQTFAPRRVRGVAVPGRFNFSNRFSPTSMMGLNTFEAVGERVSSVEGGVRLEYRPRLERELDGGGLSLTRSAVALIPAGFDSPKGGEVKAVVSFYVDEEGKVRLPNVEAAASPLLVANAIEAVRHWGFRPPTVQGRPVLVFALFAVSFEPGGPPAGPPPATR